MPATSSATTVTSTPIQTATPAPARTTTPVPATNLTRSWFNEVTGTIQQKQEALKAALTLIAEKGWALSSKEHFFLAGEIAEYIHNMITYDSSDSSTRSNAYGGLVLKKGTCWAYAQAFFFVAKELGMPVQIIAVREMNPAWGKIVVGNGDYDPVTGIFYGQVGSDHMAVVLTVPGRKVWVEVQGGGMYTFLDDPANAVVYRLIITATEGGLMPSTDNPILCDQVQGDTISISARPLPGYRFEKWTSSNGGSFGDANISATYFNMPGNDTTITANFVL